MGLDRLQPSGPNSFQRVVLLCHGGAPFRVSFRPKLLRALAKFSSDCRLNILGAFATNRDHANGTLRDADPPTDFGQRTTDESQLKFHTFMFAEV